MKKTDEYGLCWLLLLLPPLLLLVAPMTTSKPLSDWRGLDGSIASSTPFIISLLGCVAAALTRQESEHCLCSMLCIFFHALPDNSLAHGVQSRQICRWCSPAAAAAAASTTMLVRCVLDMSQTTERYQLQVLNYLRTTAAVYSANLVGICAVCFTSSSSLLLLLLLLLLSFTHHPLSLTLIIASRATFVLR